MKRKSTLFTLDREEITSWKISKSLTVEGSLGCSFTERHITMTTRLNRLKPLSK